MAIRYRRGLGVEDCNFDLAGVGATVTFEDTRGDEHALTLMNASHIPLTVAARTYGDNVDTAITAISDIASRAVTVDGTQTISGEKTFTAPVTFEDMVTFNTAQGGAISVGTLSAESAEVGTLTGETMMVRGQLTANDVRVLAEAPVVELKSVGTESERQEGIAVFMEDGSVTSEAGSLLWSQGTAGTLVEWSVGSTVALTAELTGGTALLTAVPTNMGNTASVVRVDAMNEAIEAVAAYYVTKDAEGNPFETKAELDGATVYYSGGVERVPTRNDYTIVREDEEHLDEQGRAQCTRYIWNNQWEFQYVVEKSGLSAAQWAAINSGVNATKVAVYDGYATSKQDTLVAGKNITLSGATISASGGFDEEGNVEAGTNDFGLLTIDAERYFIVGANTCTEVQERTTTVPQLFLWGENTVEPDSLRPNTTSVISIGKNEISPMFDQSCIVLGWGNDSYGGAVIVGDGNRGTNFDVVLGNNNTVGGDGVIESISQVIGSNNIVNVDRSVVIGQSNTVGSYSLCFGWGNTVGTHSLCFGGDYFPRSVPDNTADFDGMTLTNAVQGFLVAGDNVTLDGNTVSAEGAAKWGEIGGTITDQLDLVAQLATKAEKSIYGDNSIQLSNTAGTGARNFVTIGTRSGEAGNMSACIGDDNRSSGHCSLVVGTGIRAEANNSLACGSSIIVTSGASNSLVFGGANNCSNSYSFMFGYQLSSSAVQFQTVIGRSNLADANAYLIVGNGTSSGARRNAFTVTRDGDIKVLRGGTFGGDVYANGTKLTGGTTYVPGNNVQINGNVISATDTVYDDTEVRGLISGKQDSLSAGSGIAIVGNTIYSGDNVTEWEVLANDTKIEAGADAYEGIDLLYTAGTVNYCLAQEVPVGMTERFNVYALTANGFDVDWGDGTFEHYDTPEYKEETKDVSHTYSTEGLYTVKVIGRFCRIKHTSTDNLMYKVFEGGMFRLAREHRSLQDFCKGALRLVQVDLPSWGDFGNILSLNGTFAGCKNLRSATGVRRFLGVVTAKSTFEDCWAMVNTDYQMPPMVALADNNSDGYRRIFYSNTQDAQWQLTCDLNSLFPEGGFAQDIVDLNSTFYHGGTMVCYPNITLTQATADKLAQKLWLSGKTFRGYTNLFLRFTDDVRQYIPVAWGGTKADE